MNPILLLVFILFLLNPGNRRSFQCLPSYIDTFKMELYLDRLVNMTRALEKINRLNQGKRIPPMGKPTHFSQIENVCQSMDALKDFLGEGKTNEQINNLIQGLSSVGKFKDMEQIISTFAPLLSTILNSDKTP
ncbi:MAG: hypothetical protein ACOX4U_06515 [Anaerovoracaceae bacterium]|jgi:hypothetical protein